MISFYLFLQKLFLYTLFKYFAFRCLIALSFIVCLSLASYGQILNVDRAAGVDTTGKRFFALIGLTASADKQKKDLVDVSGNADFSRLLKDSFVVVLKINTDLTTNGADIIQNTGYFHLRIRDNDSRILAPEVFSQFQWNGVLGMEQRILFGSNLRWRVIHRDNDDLFMGLGLMYEYEKWNFKGVAGLEKPEELPVVISRKWRINHYLKWAVKISQKTDLVLINFTQLPVERPGKPRIASSATLNFRLFKWLGLAVNYDSMYDVDPPVPISKYYYSLKGQLTMSF